MGLFRRLISGQFANLTLGLPLLLYVITLEFFAGPTFAKFVCGLVAMLVVPGYLLSAAMRLCDCQESRLGFSFIFGLLIQIGNIYALYIIDVFARFNQLNFQLYIMSTTAAETLFLIIMLNSRLGPSEFSRSLLDLGRSKPSATSLFFLLCFAGNLLFQSFNSSALLPDGALYLDTARYIVNNGAFSSLIINDAGLYPYQNQAALSLNVGTALLYSLFFSIGDVSLQAAKWGASLIGALLVYPVFEIAKLSFGKRAGAISVAIVAAHPLFRYYSSILYGPEIASALLVAVALFLIRKVLEPGSLCFSALSGMVLFLCSFVWRGDTVPAIGAFAIILASANFVKERGTRALLLQSLGTLLVFAMVLIALLVSPDVKLWVAALIAICALLVACRFLPMSSLRQVTVITAVYLAFTQVYLIRFYRFPTAIVYTPSQPIFAYDVQSMINRFGEFIWPSWITTSLSIVALSALISIIWVSKRALIPFSFFLVWLVSRLLLLPAPSDLFIIFDERFYLSITAVFIVFSAGFFSRAASVVGRILQIYPWGRLTKVLGALPGFHVHFALLVAMIFALILGISVPAYANSVSTFRANAAEENSWIPVIDWIHNNTRSVDILLTTGSPRLWAWFADREVVGTNVVKDNLLLPLDQIGPAGFVNLITMFSPKFIIFDSTYQASLLFLPKLSYLYGNFQPGTTFLLNSTSESVTLEVIISSISTVNNGTVTLYRIVT